MIDVVILSHAKNDSLKKITDDCLKSLFDSESENTFNVIVIEGNHNVTYPNLKVIHLQQPFNYNAYMNIGASLGTSEFIAFCNNDLIFHKGWASELLRYSFDSSSPKCPINPLQIGMNSLHLGYETSKHLSGWCLFLRRKWWDYMEGFDEDFEFWCADDSYREQLKFHNVNHYLIASSLVTHLGSKTLKTLTREQNDYFTIEQKKRYVNKFRHNS
jgi:glycosyltransferase involved in cell wall biosynthesis